MVRIVLWAKVVGLGVTQPSRKMADTSMAVDEGRVDESSGSLKRERNGGLGEDEPEQCRDNVDIT